MREKGVRLGHKQYRRARCPFFAKDFKSTDSSLPVASDFLSQASSSATQTSAVRNSEVQNKCIYWCDDAIRDSSRRWCISFRCTNIKNNDCSNNTNNNIVIFVYENNNSDPDWFTKCNFLSHFSLVSNWNINFSED